MFYTVKKAAEKLNITPKTIYERIKENKIKEYYIYNEKIVMLADEPKPTVISFINLKGGVAKTTSCCMIATYLAKVGFKTLLIDLDHQDHCKLFFKVPPHKYSSKELLFSNIELSNIITKTEISYLNIITSDLELTLLQQELEDPYRLKNRLASHINLYDFILIDNSPSYNIININSILASDYILIPTQLDELSISGLQKMIESIYHLTKDTSIEFLGVFATLVNPRTVLADEYKKRLQDLLGDKLFDTFIPLDQKLKEISSLNINIFDYKEKSAGSQAYKKLTKEIVLKL